MADKLQPMKDKLVGKPMPKRMPYVGGKPSPMIGPNGRLPAKPFPSGGNVPMSANLPMPGVKK